MIETLYWHWWVLALAFIIFDLLIGGSFALIWTGVAAGATGLCYFFLPSLDLTQQFVCFAIFELLCLWLWRQQLIKRVQPPDAHPTLNNRLAAQIGQSYHLIRDVQDNRSSIRLHDSDWLVQCDEALPKAAKVTIVGVEGSMFIVKPALED